MKVLITGADGQVGRALAHRVPGAVALGRAGLDLSDRAAVARVVADARPDLVINAAAYTAVDRAETEVDTATAVNTDGPGWLAQACAKQRARLVHLSTDYVFNGSGDRPWVESDAIDPQNAYGRTKAQGEQRVREALPTALIVRTAWVFSAHGSNFVKTMLRLAAEREVLRVVADQRGCPTWADDVAAVALTLGLTGASGTLHFAGSPATTWHGFATAIVEEARLRRPLRVTRVDAITTAEYPTPAKRPANSVLDCTRIAALGIDVPDWRTGLRAVVGELLP